MKTKDKINRRSVYKMSTRMRKQVKYEKEGHLIKDQYMEENQ